MEVIEVRRQKAEGRTKQPWLSILLLLAICLLPFDCAKPKPVATPLPPPPAIPTPAPAPVVEVPPPAPRLPTLDEVRALRASNQLDQYEAGLKSLTQAADVLTQRRALALLALFYVDQKRTADALPMLGQAADADPLVAPWLRLRIAEIDAAAGQWADALLTTIRIIHD